MYMGPVDKIPPIITKIHFLMPGSLKCFVINCGVIRRFAIAMRMNMRAKIGAILMMSLLKNVRLDEKSVKFTHAMIPYNTMTAPRKYHEAYCLFNPLLSLILENAE